MCSEGFVIPTKGGISISFFHSCVYFYLEYNSYFCIPMILSCLYASYFYVYVLLLIYNISSYFTIISIIFLSSFLTEYFPTVYSEF